MSYRKRRGAAQSSDDIKIFRGQGDRRDRHANPTHRNRLSFYAPASCTYTYTCRRYWLKKKIIIITPDETGDVFPVKFFSRIRPRRTGSSFRRNTLYRWPDIYIYTYIHVIIIYSKILRCWPGPSRCVYIARSVAARLYCIALIIIIVVRRVYENSPIIYQRRPEQFFRLVNLSRAKSRFYFSFFFSTSKVENEVFSFFDIDLIVVFDRR